MKSIIFGSAYSLSGYIFIMGILLCVGGYLIIHIIKQRKEEATLLSNLYDIDWRVRDNAMRVLLKKRNKAAKVLIQLLNSKYANLRWQAAEALGFFKIKSAVKPLVRRMLDPEQKVSLKAVEALGSIGEKSVSVLVESIKHGKMEFREKAFDALVLIGPSAVCGLKALLKVKEGDLGWRAIRALGEIGDVGAISCLSHVLSSSGIDQSERWLAAQALGRIGSKRAIGILERFSDDDDYSIQEVTRKALKQVRQSTV